MAKRKTTSLAPKTDPDYDTLFTGLSSLLDQARRAVVRSVNGILTATYWEMGRRIVEFEQGGEARATYGEGLMTNLARDLTAKYGRGYSKSNLFLMRSFFLNWEIFQTLSGKFEARVATTDSSETTMPAFHSGPTDILTLASVFPLPWSHYVRLMSVENINARQFYEAEALRGGWSIRQLSRQIGSQFYERTALSKRKAAMLTKGQIAKPEDKVTIEEAIRDPYLLEFLNLKNEYSENELEEALVQNLETFLLELGDDFAFVGRKRRLRIDNTWFVVDLLFFHRILKSLLIVDLKVGPFTHADAGQMHLYVNYARENWMREGENPPVGLILCAEKGHDTARYALEGINNKVLAATYRTALPEERRLIEEMNRTRRMLEVKAEPPHAP